MEEGRMGCVNVVTAVNSTGADHTKRRLVVLHKSCLNRRGLCTKKHVLREIERVLNVTGRMVSGSVESIEVIRRGKVRRAKLYYLRDRVGKATRVKEKI